METKGNIQTKLNKLSLKELRNLADTIGIGIIFNEDESKIEDLKGEIIDVLSMESENRIIKAIEDLENA